MCNETYSLIDAAFSVTMLILFAALMVACAGLLWLFIKSVLEL